MSMSIVNSDLLLHLAPVITRKEEVGRPHHVAHGSPVEESAKCFQQ